MATTSRLLAAGPGWRVNDFICTSGPHDRPFAEQYDAACIAAVVEGTFQCRSTRGGAMLVPGALLLGNPGECFECGHEHGTGDRCISFHFSPDCFEAIVAVVPGARGTVFPVPRLPPLPSLVPLLAAAEAAREGADAALFEEVAVRLVGAVAGIIAGSERDVPSLRPRDERRVTRALRRIEDRAEEPLALADLAREAAMSPYHFLRTFHAVAGMTPHQYLLRTRLHRAAVRLHRSREPISTIAFDAGFNDLSTFNRRFRRLMGASPSAYREAAGPR
jgi:AraC-like DNA-binding protein